MRQKNLPLNDDLNEKSRRKSMNVDVMRRKSIVAPLSKMTEKEALGVVKNYESTPLPKQSVEEISKNYEEWMKIAADNKINANNSWSVQLIDYFHELRLMKEGENINFQKASCTLDGCVKVYSTRVDSVVLETSRFLSGLAENKSEQTPKQSDGSEVGNDSDDEAETRIKAKKKSMREGNTLEVNEHALNVKKFDLEFTVDPLFRKTCADFDESGAGGLLLNHLSINERGRLIFDASDVDLNQPEHCEDVKTNQQQIDASIVKILDPMVNLKELVIVPEYDNNKPNASMNDDESDVSSQTDEMEMAVVDIPDLDADEIIIDEDEPVEAMNFSPPAFEDDFPVVETETSTPPVAQPKSLNFSNNAYSYFDDFEVRNWSSLHWKVYKAPKKPVTIEKPEKRTLKKKEPVFIDFESSEPIVFQKAEPHTLVLSNSKLSLSSLNILPIDIQYSFKSLDRLFMKPQYTITMFQQTRRGDQERQFDEAENDYDNDVAHSFNDYAEMPNNDEGYEAFPTLEYTQPTIMFSSQLKDTINYSKTAKRVDVKKLKENIWTAIDEHRKDPDLNFSTVMENTHFDSVSESQAATVPFYFICLLHLANEKGLELKGNSNLSNISIK